MLALLPPIDPEVVDYLVALTTGDGGLAPASDLMGLRTAASTSTQEEFGFGRQQIAADITAGLPPQALHAARGDFDPDAIVEATHRFRLGRRRPGRAGLLDRLRVGCAVTGRCRGGAGDLGPDSGR